MNIEIFHRTHLGFGIGNSQVWNTIYTKYISKKGALLFRARAALQKKKPSSRAMKLEGDDRTQNKMGAEKKNGRIWGELNCCSLALFCASVWRYFAKKVPI